MISHRYRQQCLQDTWLQALSSDDPKDLDLAWSLVEVNGVQVVIVMWADITLQPDPNWLLWESGLTPKCFGSSLGLSSPNNRVAETATDLEHTMHQNRHHMVLMLMQILSAAENLQQNRYERTHPLTTTALDLVVCYYSPSMIRNEEFCI